MYMYICVCMYTYEFPYSTQCHIVVELSTDHGGLSLQIHQATDLMTTYLETRPKS